MRRLNSFFRCSSKLRWLLLTLLATQASPAGDLAYRVILNGGPPVTDAYVTLQTPGGSKTIITKTDGLGKFRVSGINANKVLVTIEKNGRLVYRGINKVEPVLDEKVIDLTEEKAK